ncbi:CoA-acylating methylmalonate-semialdehyde dehydrogenase [Deinococcus cellulosilyticus]|uniref:methylmalonate-semialdehyde dehydrogenase (CoA acylating) n=1 Tax=Deinococcus cellulosilyticus (strain DSM 18568 / NBRC 106333 / KACC 11606 / 5516J-15) TaxID=1223518 RepID=A0A511N1D2_DEIC1|nr:CoA-acylating methylmalonate-semialdehyde dehydrogenase [Deinococcus cellulosilyticus]GEM46268.1 methylmalonate-semialdehyde dehydrogenase (CoA acylating) [Deinococcus cellulosilyticus NBRC 106333 = KACC 11606]
MTLVKDRVRNFVNGQWEDASTQQTLPIYNPATAEVIGQTPVTPQAEVNRIVQHAVDAWWDWRSTPVVDRVQPLFKLKFLLEENIQDLARTITLECGKTHAEAVGEMRRGIENVETACGMPTMIQGYNNEDIARGIDEHLFRQPLGVVTAITPFNFPGMIPLWFLPYAVATGNCFILKPSEKVPLTSQKIFELIEKAGFPAGVLQLLNGSKETVDALLDHEDVRAVSFVGSTPVAKYIYSRASANGKRAQCQGGAKNPVIIMPDADPDMTTRILADSAFGCAGQRCLAASIAVTVGEAYHTFKPLITDAADSRKLGFGSDQGVDMGPVISKESQDRIKGLLDRGLSAGAECLTRDPYSTVEGHENGYFIRPTVIENVTPGSELAETEIFGPVLSVMRASTLEDAIDLVNRSRYGNQACLFTSSGATARAFRHRARAGNIGINVGIAAPMAFFPFSGWKDSFFGDLHAQGKHAVEFYTETKVVVERWPKEWSRVF